MRKQFLSITMLVVSLLLAGCRGTLEIGLETGSPTSTVEIAELDATLTPVVITPATPDPTAAPPTWTATPTSEPAATPTWTATPAPTSTSP
ncbi:MAG: hypothetical protein GWN58_07045, partial [Anaerolineae bacterium]|nr:hypothetical protein [Anaerolineae bacterium]